MLACLWRGADVKMQSELRPGGGVGKVCAHSNAAPVAGRTISSAAVLAPESERSDASAS